MELLTTMVVVIGLSFGAVIGAAVGICLLCIGFGTPYDPKAPVKKWFEPSPEDAAQTGPNYVLIFGTLLLMTVITVALSRVNLGATGNTVLAVLVAAFKASLVALFFMHLKYEKRLMFALILIPAFFFAALFFGLLPDLVTNHYNPEKTERPGFGVGLDTVK